MRRVKVNCTEPYEGYFHCFSSDYGCDRIQYPVAIVEKDDGTVTAVDIDLIQFVKEKMPSCDVTGMFTQTRVCNGPIDPNGFLFSTC